MVTLPDTDPGSVDSLEQRLRVPQDASEYSFPMNPYDIQLDFMRRLFETIENGSFGIFESPTGTGKSLSIICGALTWLKHNEQRTRLAKSADSNNTVSDDLPAWVAEYEKNRLAEEAVSEDDTKMAKYQKWVANTRRREAAERKANRFGGSAPRKNNNNSDAAKRKADADQESDAEVVVDEYYSDNEKAGKHKSAGDGEVQYSAAVRKLLARRAANKPYYDSDDSDNSDAASDDDDAGIPEEPSVTKIFYASRTHSQLQQFVGEIKRTDFAKYDKVKCVSLGSRWQLCVNPRAREGCSSVHPVNERCLEMQQNSKKKRCTYLPVQQTPMLDFKDTVGQKIMDIEELAREGQRLST
ncbi:ATP-dependent DNA helicase chl1, partial [Dipsacomyces acuminosporus]